jgi:hypothetical protein
MGHVSHAATRWSFPEGYPHLQHGARGLQTRLYLGGARCAFYSCQLLFWTVGSRASVGASLQRGGCGAYARRDAAARARARGRLVGQSARPRRAGAAGGETGTRRGGVAIHRRRAAGRAREAPGRRSVGLGGWRWAVVCAEWAAGAGARASEWAPRRPAARQSNPDVAPQPS